MINETFRVNSIKIRVGEGTFLPKERAPQRVEKIFPTRIVDDEDNSSLKINETQRSFAHSKRK